jgi:hypothetical protein
MHDVRLLCFLSKAVKIRVESKAQTTFRIIPIEYRILPPFPKQYLRVTEGMKW